jgi:hypothetical protein
VPSFAPRSVRVPALAIMAVAALPASASAASLVVTVKPLVHKGELYSIKVGGSFAPQEIAAGQTAYLVTQLQYTHQACAARADLEAQRVVLGVFARSEKKSPFKASSRYQASATGMRRVCAYLYAQPVTASDEIAPIATATAAYRTSKK